MKKNKMVLTGLLTGFFSFGLIALVSVPAYATSTTYYKWTGASSGTAGQNGCASNCWSVAGNWDVSTDGGSTYSAASTAPQSTDNSGLGDDLVFDISGLSGNLTLNNDLTNLTVGTIQVINSNTDDYAYTVNGLALTVTGDVGTSDDISYGVNMNNNLTFTGSNLSVGHDTYNPIAFGGNVTVASGSLTAYDFFSAQTLTVDGGATFDSDGVANVSNMAGSGDAVMLTPVSGTQYPNVLQLTGTTSTFSGNFEVQSGGQLSIYNVGETGTASITIENGGQLYVYDDPSIATSTDSLTLTNNIKLDGDAAGVYSEQKGAIIAGLWDGKTEETDGNLNLKLTGSVTLTGNTSLASIYDTTTTYNFTDLKLAGFSLKAVPEDQPEYGPVVLQQNGKATTSSKKTTKAPGTPDTGAALVSAKAAMPAIGSLLVVGGIVLASKKHGFRAGKSSR